MSDILRQLTANLIPTVSGGAYQDAREVSIVWNTRRKHRFLPKFRCRMHQTRPSTLFSPVFSLAREKIWPPEARQKRPRRNEPPQATSLFLCARFFLSKPQTEFAVWVFPCRSETTSQSASLTALREGSQGAAPPGGGLYFSSGPHFGSGSRCIAPKTLLLRSGYCACSVTISSLTSCRLVCLSAGQTLWTTGSS